MGRSQRKRSDDPNYPTCELHVVGRCVCCGRRLCHDATHPRQAIYRLLKPLRYCSYVGKMPLEGSITEAVCPQMPKMVTQLFAGLLQNVAADILSTVCGTISGALASSAGNRRFVACERVNVLRGRNSQ